MTRPQPSLCPLLLVCLSVFCSTDASPQRASRAFEAYALPDGGPPRAALQSQDASATYQRKLAGFGAGVVAGALFSSIDAIIGENDCIGSGNYLFVCRTILVGATSIGGGLSALAGMLVRSEQPPGRFTRIFVGSALGAVGTFLVSTVPCHQEDASNPEFLCGYDGMVSGSAILAGATVGGIVGALIGGGSESLQVRSLGMVPAPDGRVGLGAALTLQTR